MFQKFDFIVFVSFTSFLLITSEGSTPIRRCTDDIPSPNYVQINDCEAYPCTVFAGSTANMTIQFSAVNNNTENIHAEVVAYVNKDAFPYQIPNDYADVCKHLDNNAHCPLNPGDNVTYSLTIPLDKSFPNIYVETEVALVDENQNCISCFVADIRVKELKHHQEQA